MIRLRWLVLLALLPAVAFAQIEFSPTAVSSFYDGALNVTCGDLDGDGDMELIGAAESADNFAWWDFDGANWVEHLLEPVMSGPTNVSVADLDNDGDLEILGAAYLDEVIFWNNDGDAGFTPYIITSHTGIKGIQAWDIDEDGDKDLFIADESSGEGGGLYWLENIGRDDVDWPVHIIWDEEGMSNIDLGDIDNDGDVDVASCGRFNGDVGWWEYLGLDSWQRHLLIDDFGDSRSVKIADINGDGLLDLAATSRSGFVSWWEQTDAVWIRHDVTESFSGADDVDVADIDGDGDMDLAAVAVTADEVAWFEQTTDGWQYYSIDATMDYASGVHASDIDGDGDVDIVGCGYYSDQVILYEQIGNVEPDPVTLTLNPVFTEIPAGGGTVLYDASLLSIIGNTFQGVSYWVTFILPDQTPVGPFDRVLFTITPFMDITLPLTQDVPGNASPGDYTLTGHVGYYNNPNLQIEDSFTFTKAGAAMGGSSIDPSEWQMTGFSLDNQKVDAGALSGTGDLLMVSPNPFNAVSKVSLYLSDGEDVRLRVVNLLGREVADVYSGRLQTGQHGFTIDATNLSSGIYFLVGQIGDNLVSNKLVVLK